MIVTLFKYSIPRLLSPPRDRTILGLLTGGLVNLGVNFRRSHTHK